MIITPPYGGQSSGGWVIFIQFDRKLCRNNVIHHTNGIRNCVTLYSNVYNVQQTVIICAFYSAETILTINEINGIFSCCKLKLSLFKLHVGYTSIKKKSKKN